MMYKRIIILNFDWMCFCVVFVCGPSDLWHCDNGIPIQRAVIFRRNSDLGGKLFGCSTSVLIRSLQTKVYASTNIMHD